MINRPITRRVKVCFDVEVQIQPLSARRRTRKPELEVLRKALLDNPAWLDQAISYQALLQVTQRMAMEMNIWNPFYPDDNLIHAAYEQSPESFHHLLYEHLVHRNLKPYVDALYTNSISTRIIDAPYVLDGKSGERLNWNFMGDILLSPPDNRRRYLTVFTKDKCILCLNLVRFTLEEMPLSKIDRRAYEFNLILAFVAENLPAEAQEELTQRIQKTFDNAPVEIHAAPQPICSKP